MNRYATEADNNVIVSAYPMKECYQPHIAVQLSSYQGKDSTPVLIVARLNPEDARCIGAALQQSAEHIQEAYDAYLVERSSDGSPGE